MNNYPQFPLYIPTKGRSEYMITSKALSRMGQHHYLVVEEQEIELYKAALKRDNINATILKLDNRYKEQYELCDNLGLTKSTGPGPARNFAWDHSIQNGYSWHWVMDDNIRAFYRLCKNKIIPINNAVIFKIIEDFCLRYENIAMAGLQYEMFAPRLSEIPPFIKNTRIYSCNLIRNDIPYRWRGRYNEDTILSIDILKAGYCTIQFNAFLQKKMRTQTLPGGNTDEFYWKEGKRRKGEQYADKGTLAKSQMLAKVHPDVAKVVWRYGRIHHHVDYRPFKNNQLIFRDDYTPEQGVNNYGMKLVRLSK